MNQLRGSLAGHETAVGCAGLHITAASPAYPERVAARFSAANMVERAELRPQTA
jgi:hypothetical protein